MATIRLKSIEFSTPPFRKLDGLKIEIADRVTVIAGHNGIGKSTIIGLIANSSGNRTSNPKNYFDNSFQASFHELFHLSHDFDYIEDKKQKPSVILEYQIDDEILHKKCNVTKHTEPDGSTRLKVVPRTVEKELGGNLGITPDGKVPIPTIYLGMSRMTPIGEHSKEAIQKKEMKKFNADDSEYIREKFRSVIHYEDASDKTILSHKFTASKKSSKLPNLNHDSLSISLGQDSLGSIITALASFNQLKREDSDYSGGILVIDEIDAGFHPHAQKKLISLLKKEAKRLDLQIIATSHSLTVIKEVLVEKDEHAQRKIIDNVIYLMGTSNPMLMPDPSYPKIRGDMLLEPVKESQKNPVVKIYFEDDEAKYFFEKLVESKSSDLVSKYTPIAAKAGCDTLMGLAHADDYFQSVIIVFDNDVMSFPSKKKKIDEKENFLSLPGCISFTEATPAEERTPEAIIRSFLKKLLDRQSEYKAFWQKSNAANFSSDYVRSNFLTPDEDELKQKERDRNKHWFGKSKEYIEQMDLISLWAQENADSVSVFIDQLRVAISHQLNTERQE